VQQNYPPSAYQPVSTGTISTVQPTSGAWWLLPFFFFIVGGIIAFAVVRPKNKGKANGLLVFGIIWTIIWSIIWYAYFYALFFG